MSRMTVRKQTRNGRCDQPGSMCLIEQLESRELLSHHLAHVAAATPDFLVYHPAGVSQPAAVSTPVGLTPAQVRHAYGVDLARFGTIVGDGSGQTIAIVDAYNAPNIVSDLHVFDTQFGLPDPTLTVIGQDGSTRLPGTDPAGRGNSWAMETSLDVEWAHAIAPNAKIVLVEAKSASNADLFAAINTARNYAGVSVVSMSWGGGESSTQTSFDSYFTTPAGHNGVTFVASSGDSGAYAPGTTTRQLEYPAGSRNVLAVGGTYLSIDASGNYISETGWGNGTRSGTSGGSGGGISRIVSQPSYQRGVVTQTTTMRATPDVAFLADPASGAAVYDSWDSSTSPWVQVGGTSLAAPMWAAVIAIANQGRALAGQGTLDGPSQTLPMIYSLPSRDFHDITSGNNGYAAGPGFDLVTGRGTPIVNLLVGDLSGNTATPVPTIGSLTVSPNSVTAGTTVTLSAFNVLESSGTISSVAFYRETNGASGLQTGSDTLLGQGTKNGSTWSLAVSTNGLATGSYTYYAVATDTANATSDAATTVLTIAAPPPLNDNFSSAAVLTGTSVSVTGTNVSATKQAGEPNIAGNVGGKSVWYNWTAPASGKVYVDTHGSNFDTTLGVYTGSVVSSLSLVASNDDDPNYLTYTSAVTFNAVAGQTYRIAVDGYNASSGNIMLNLGLVTAPVNNNFASALKLTGRPLTWQGSNVGATRESGEPHIAGNVGGASVWVAWTATTTGIVSLNTHGSNFDTMVGVYTGSAVSSLTLVASNDDDPAGGTLTSAVTFNAVAGRTYYIAIDGYNGTAGTIVLNLQ